MRSSRPMRCSATSGLHGRSKRTRRRQNSKLRPSPPHSVETRRLGPSGSRNWATSMSRRAEDSSSWKTPVATWARRLSSVAQPLERLAVGDEDERLLARPPASAGRCRASQARRGSAASARSARRASAASSRPRRAWSAAPEASARRTRSAFCRRPRAWGAGARRTASTSASRSRPAALALDGDADARRQAADVHAPRRARAGRERLRPREARLERLVLGEVGGPQQLEQAEEAVHVVVERDRGEEEQVPAEGGDRRDRAPGRAARVAGRAAQPVGLVHHEEVDAGLRRAGGELRPRDERLEGDHGAPVDVEGVEVGAVVPRHVGEPRLVEQHEDLVVLPPQLAEPLDGQRLGRDHQAPLRASRPDEAAQDEAGLDRLAEADLVGQEPAHGVGGGRALGRVELVGEEADAAAEEGAEALGLAQRGEVQARRGAGRGPRRGRRRPWPAAPRGRPAASVGPGSSGARGTRAGASPARRRVTPPAGNSTTTDRPSTDTTRPGPSSGLWRCVRRSPTFHMRCIVAIPRSFVVRATAELAFHREPSTGAPSGAAAVRPRVDHDAGSPTGIAQGTVRVAGGSRRDAVQPESLGIDRTVDTARGGLLHSVVVDN